MDANHCVAVFLLWMNFLVRKQGECSEVSLVTTCPTKCDISQCPVLQYCMGFQMVKDECGCCPKCSSDKWVHPKYPVVKTGGSCAQVKCSRFKVCMENMQGLPLCTCPNILICKRRRRGGKEVCGSDGNTYASRCHMRVAACASKLRLKVRYKGLCSPNSYMVATQEYGNDVKQDNEYSVRKRKKRNRRKEQRNHKKLRRRKRRFKKRKFQYLRQRRQRIRFFNRKKNKNKSSNKDKSSKA